VIEDCRSWNCH